MVFHGDCFNPLATLKFIDIPRFQASSFASYFISQWLGNTKVQKGRGLEPKRPKDLKSLDGTYGHKFLLKSLICYVALVNYWKQLSFFNYFFFQHIPFTKRFSFFIIIVFPSILITHMTYLPKSYLQKPLLLRTSFISTLSSSPPTPEEVSHLILQQKSPSKSLETFEWASKIPTFNHNHLTYNALINSLISFSHLQKANQILLSLPPPLITHEPSVISLVRAFGRAHKPHNAINLLNLFNKQNPPSLNILNSILYVLVKEDIDLARVFFRKKMKEARDSRTYGILMKGLCETNRIQEAFKLLQLMKKIGHVNPVIYNTLIHGLCRNRKVGRARSLMSEMGEFSDVTFNIMISAYCGENNHIQALVVLEKCFDSGFVPDKISITKMVEVMCEHGRAMESVEVLEKVEKKGGVIDVVCYNTLIKGFCKMEKPEVGKRVLKEMERKGCLPNVHTYNILISGFCDTGKVDRGMDVFREIGMVGISPNFETFDVLIKGFCRDGRVEEGLRILDTMEELKTWRETKIGPYNSILYGFYHENRLEEAYKFLNEMEALFPKAVGRCLRIIQFCKDGNVVEANSIFDQMVNGGEIPNVLVYVSLIEQMCDGNNVRKAFDLMNEMVEKGYFPIISTFNALNNAFCEEGNLKCALKLLEEMEIRGCSPNIDTYNSLIKGFCNEGEIGRACSFLVKMIQGGLAPDHSTWNCLLLCAVGSNFGFNEINIAQLCSLPE